MPTIFDIYQLVNITSTSVGVGVATKWGVPVIILNIERNLKVCDWLESQILKHGNSCVTSRSVFGHNYIASVWYILYSYAYNHIA